MEETNFFIPCATITTPEVQPAQYTVSCFDKLIRLSKYSMTIDQYANTFRHKLALCQKNCSQNCDAYTRVIERLDIYLAIINGNQEACMNYVGTVQDMKILSVMQEQIDRSIKIRSESATLPE